jgi:hypothetical protein
MHGTVVKHNTSNNKMKTRRLQYELDSNVDDIYRSGGVVFFFSVCV